MMKGITLDFDHTVVEVNKRNNGSVYLRLIDVESKYSAYLEKAEFEEVIKAIGDRALWPAPQKEPTK